ncbi:MAG: pilin [Azoarcus sp.]|nr:pilin [Azoarcus sp.]
MTEASQTGMSAAPTENDSFACGEGGSATAPVSQYVESISTSPTGVITVTARNISQLGSNNTLTLTPFTDANTTTPAKDEDFERGKEHAIKSWQCGGSIEPKYLPSSCR